MIPQLHVKTMPRPKVTLNMTEAEAEENFFRWEMLQIIAFLLLWNMLLPQEDKCTNSIFYFFFFLHACIPLQLYRICFWKSWKSIARSGNTDSLSKVPDSVIHEKQQQQTLRFWFLPRVTNAFYWNLPKSLLDALRMHERQKWYRFTRGSALFMHKRHEAEEVNQKFPRSWKLNRLESGRDLSKRFVYDRKHGQVYWSHTCKTISSEKGMFPNI